MLDVGDWLEGLSSPPGGFQTVVLEKALESPLDCKEIKPVNPKGNQPWIFIGRIDAEGVAPVLWLPDVKSWPTGKDSKTGKDWGQEKRGAEDELVGWYHWLNGHEFEQTPGDSEGQGRLECCSLWGHKESDTTEQLNSNNNVHLHLWKFTTWRFVCRGLIVVNTKPLLLGEIQHWLSVSLWSHFH